MPVVQPSNKIAFVGKDDPAEELPEPDPNVVRLAELEAENQRLRDDLRHLESALRIAARVLQPSCHAGNG